MDLLQTLLVYMSLVFATSVQVAPEPSEIPDAGGVMAGYMEITPTPSPAPTPVPTIDITPNPAYKTIQMGDRGDQVRELQERLQLFGYYAGEIDGAYGNQTRQAVERFQYMHGLVADGIAGRHTLTVLYESQEIRLPQGIEPTPEPTAVAQLTAAMTPEPVSEWSFVPVLTETPAPTASPSPTAVPLPMEKLDGYSIAMNGNETPITVYKQGETVYLPVVAVLSHAGVNVISSSSLELEEYAFASGMDLVRFTHTVSKANEPIDLQVYRNDAPQLVPDRSLYMADKVLYIPAVSLESMTGFTFSADEEQQKIVIEAPVS